MAARLACSRARVVAYLPSLRSATRHFRAFSSYDERKPGPGLNMEEIETLIKGHLLEWPDTRLGVLSPQDPRFPLPGNVGPEQQPKAQPQTATPRPRPADILTEPTSHERQLRVVLQHLEASKLEDQKRLESLEGDGALESSTLALECVAMDMPELLKKDFQDLFPGHDFSRHNLTVITLSQHTEHNMTMWSPDVEEERDTLLDTFIQSASEICVSLQDAGYWADFIDPSSGQPYLSAHTNSTLFETDERFRHLGFEINDLGCCKVISHHLWGSNSYVGCLFTDAPLDHPVIRQLGGEEDGGDEGDDAII